MLWCRFMFILSPLVLYNFLRDRSSKYVQFKFLKYDKYVQNYKYFIGFSRQKYVVQTWYYVYYYKLTQNNGLSL